MSVDTELWTCEDGDLGVLLPRLQEWRTLGGVFEFDGGGWLLTVCAPEAIALEEVPAQVAALVDGLRFRLDIGIEPSDPPPHAWAFVREVVERLGGELRGAGLDPESGRAVSWAR
jgi:hypothetical protein